MFPAHLDKSATNLLVALAVAGLSFGVACSSSPDTHEQPVTAEPSESSFDDHDPYAEHGDPVHAEQPQEPVGAPPAADGVDDEELAQIADVIIASAALEDQFEDQIQAIETQEQAQQLEAEIMAEMEQQIAAAGLTVAQYEQIITQINTDPQAAQRLQQILEERGHGHILQQGM